MSKIIDVDFDWLKYDEKQVLNITRHLKEKLKEYLDQILRIENSDLSFKNFIHVGEDFNAEITNLTAVLFPFTNLHIAEKIRKAARKVELEVSKILSEFAYNEDLYQKFNYFFKNQFQIEKKTLSVEEIKIVEDMEKGYKKMGMHLNKKAKKKLLDLKNKANKIAQDFEVLHTKNYERGLWFKKVELEGIPENYFSGFKYDDKMKKYFINCSGSDRQGTDYPILKKFCTNFATREKATICNEQSVGNVNTKKFAQILKIRCEIVKILGFKTWAELATSDEMMNKPVEIVIFLEDLISKLKPDLVKQFQKIEKTLLQSKLKLSTTTLALGEETVKKNEIKINEAEYKPYFEVENVIKVIFKTWENLFDIKTELVSDFKLMHTDTTFYKFSDLKTGEFFGYGCLDLFPRVGKYGHACVADIFKKSITVAGDKRVGFTYLICNFKKNNTNEYGGKTFIALADMMTLYHEAGHMLHMILMKNSFVSTGQTSRDFVEIPSQFHENFLLNKEYVNENFKHFETGEDMDEEMLENIKSFFVKNENSAWVRTSLLALYDQELSGKNILKYASNFKLLDKKFEDMWKKVMQIPATKNRHFVSGFAHLVGGYDAKYYSYVISRVYAQDFWNKFSEEGVKKSEQSEKYKVFLESANTREEKILVDEFLKRKVSMKPFLVYLKK